MAEALREETKAGWQLVEKFDGNRMRLKRSASQRANDSALQPDFNPYRTAALPEATKIAMAAKRIKELKIWGGVMVASVGVTVVLGMASTAMPADQELFRVLTGITAACAGVVAAICGIGLIVRYFSR